MSMYTVVVRLHWITGPELCVGQVEARSVEDAVLQTQHFEFVKNRSGEVLAACVAGPNPGPGSFYSLRRVEVTPPTLPQVRVGDIIDQL